MQVKMNSPDSARDNSIKQEESEDISIKQEESEDISIKQEEPEDHPHPSMYFHCTLILS